jgi:guanylate kinase
MYCRLVFSGGVCAGKTTLMRMLTEEFGLEKVPDHTTRSMRENEKEGNPYNFISRDQFEKNRADKLYFEWVLHDGHYYGVPKRPLFERNQWLMDVVSSSWANFKQIPGVIGIYIDRPSSDEEIYRRASERGSDPQKIGERIKLLASEQKEGFDLYLPGDLPLKEKYVKIRELVIRCGILPKAKL